MKYFGIVNALGLCIGPPLASYFFNRTSFQSTLFMFGGLTLGVLLICALFIPEIINNKLYDMKCYKREI